MTAAARGVLTCLDLGEIADGDLGWWVGVTFTWAHNGEVGEQMFCPLLRKWREGELLRLGVQAYVRFVATPRGDLGPER